MIDQKRLPDFQYEILTDSLPAQDAVEECFTSTVFHLTTGIVLEDVDLRVYTEKERLTTKGELGLARFPCFKIS